MQIQFCLAFLHSAQLVYTDCGYPRWSVFFTLPNAIFFYFLFNDFYQKSYTNDGEKNAAKNTSNNGGDSAADTKTSTNLSNDVDQLIPNGKAHNNSRIKSISNNGIVVVEKKFI